MVDGSVGIFEGEIIGGGSKNGDFVHAGLDCAFHAVEIGDECAVDDVRVAGDSGEYFGGIGELGNPFGRDEGGGLDFGDAGLGEGVNEIDFGFGGDEGGLVLQAVAGADFGDADFGSVCWGGARSHGGR